MSKIAIPASHKFSRLRKALHDFACAFFVQYSKSRTVSWCVISAKARTTKSGVSVHDQQAYYAALRATQTTLQTENPDWEPWLLFFLGAIGQQKRALEEKIENEHEALASLPGLSVRILECTRERGRVTMADIIHATGTSRNTLKEHYRRLVAVQQLAMMRSLTTAGELLNRSPPIVIDV